MKKIMINILFAFLSLGFIADANADVLYCYEETKVGFRRDEG